MRITLNIARAGVDEPDLLSLEVFPDMTLGVLRESVEAETQIPKISQHLYHNGLLIADDSKTMEQLQIGDGEMLTVHERNFHGSAVSSGFRQSGHGRSDEDPETLRLRILGDPAMQTQLENNMPHLAAVLRDPQRFAQTIYSARNRDRQERAERQRQVALLNSDPFDPEAQARIEEMIRQERVLENLQNAVEHNPEVFGRVHMLYVDVEVNEHKVKALVDSGAQTTIMSPACAEACGIMRLVDKRFAGVARGVGTATILGRVHSAQIKIGALFLPCSFTVMEGKDVDLLLGLDMLKRYQAQIDLGSDKLMIQGVEIPFLGEADIPKQLEEASQQDPIVPGPGGATSRATTGAVPAQAQSQIGPSSTAPPPPAASRLAQPSPAPATHARPTQQSFPEVHIKTLMDLGFTREEAISALSAADGNLDYAAGLLF